MDADAYLKERVDDQITWYDAKSVVAQRYFKWLRLTEIIAAASIPLLSGFVDPERPSVMAVIALLGTLVAVIAGALGLYQHERNWIDYRTTCESLRREKYLFLTGAKPFDQEAGANYGLLVQRVEALLSQENRQWAQDRFDSADRESSTPPSVEGS